jgi:RHS repeat-associated protein
VQTTYAYDPASRLQQILHAKAGNPLEDIRYQNDASGNRTSYTRNASHPPLPTEIQATFNAANQMLSLNDKMFQYDLNGNLTSETSPAGVKTYSWGDRNRLVGISGPGLTASFKYDALGRRIEKTINGVSTQYLYDGFDIVAELQNGAVTATYLRSLNIDEPFSRTKGGQTQFYLQDALGSVVGLADSTGALATTYSYDAFGGTTASGTVSDQPFKYTGREDDGTGLYYYRARYYSPEMRRFISEDPIGLKGGDVNLMAYVGNDPINRKDPNGEKLWIDIGDLLLHLIFPPKTCKDPGECTLTGESYARGHKWCRYSCADGSGKVMGMLDNKQCPPSWNFDINPSFPY